MSTVLNSVNSVTSVNSYSAVLLPSPMVFFCLQGKFKLEKCKTNFRIEGGKIRKVVFETLCAPVAFDFQSRYGAKISDQLDYSFGS